MFESYVMLNQPKKSVDFMSSYANDLKDDLEKLIFLVGFSEAFDEVLNDSMQSKYKEIIADFSNESPNLKPSTDVRLLLKRLLANDLGNLPWVNDLYIAWGVENLDEYCGDIYSFLVANKNNKKMKNYYYETLEFIVSSRFSRLLERSDNCARDYQALYFSSFPEDKVFAFISKQKDALLKDPYITLTWSFANKQLDSETPDNGRKVLDLIIKNTDATNKYHKYSKAKIETFNSRYNNMWK